MSRKVFLLLLLCLGMVAALFLWAPHGASGDDHPSLSSDPGASASAPLDPVFPLPSSSPGRARLTEGEHPSPNPPTITGRVLGERGQPLPGARVCLGELQAFDPLGKTREDLARDSIPCSEEGLFSFSLPSEGRGTRYWVGALAPGYGALRSGPLDPGQRVELRLAPSLPVEGFVVGEGGEGIPDALVELESGRDGLDGLPAPVRTSPDGHFRLDAPVAGSYRLILRSAVGPDRALPLRLPLARSPLRLVVHPSPGLILRVRDEKGAAVSGAQVELFPPAASLSMPTPKRARCDASGRVRIGGLKPGSWTLRVRAPGFAPALRSFTWRGPGDRELDLTLSPPASLLVTVRFPGGDPVAGFPVRLQRRAEPGVRPSSLPKRSTDSQGRVRWDSLSPGRYLLLGGERDLGGVGLELSLRGEEGSGQAPISGLFVDLVPGREQRSTLVLDGHVRLRLTLHLGDRALAHAKVSITPVTRASPGRGGSAGSSRGETDASGRLPDLPLAPGSYRIRVLLPEWGIDYRGPVRTWSPGLVEEDVRLPSGEVTGQCTDPEGHLLSGIRLRLRSWKAESGIAVPELVSGADGRFRFRGVAEGLWILEARSDSFAPWTSERLSSDGRGIRDLGRISLRPACQLEGRVLGLPGGSSLFSVRVVELRKPDGQLLAQQALGAGGRFLFRGLPSGPCRLRVLRDRQVLVDRLLELRPGANQHTENLAD